MFQMIVLSVNYMN